MSLELEHLREDYQLDQLERSDLAANPFQQFERWFAAARAANLTEPNAMTLATVSPDGQPSARIVLLKGFDDAGFVFYTNYHSQKGQEIAQNPKVALNFVWLELHRQVRISGQVERLTAEESTRYFQSRPKGSQIGAWVSPQSEVIADRAVLEARKQALEAQYQDTDMLPRPEHWGGYRVRPTTLEFWQGRSNRLHDRLRYTRAAQEAWKIERLAP